MFYRNICPSPIRSCPVPVLSSTAGGVLGDERGERDGDVKEE
jgi:hypothetical protein